MNISPVGAKLFLADRRADGRADRQTDMTKLTVIFLNFTNIPKIFYCIKVWILCCRLYHANP